MILKHFVSKKEDDKTINEILKQEFHFSNKLYSKLIRKKQIYLNKEQIDTRNIVKENDLIEVNLDYEEENENIIPTKMDLDILYEDEALLIINKKVGMAVHPSMLHYEDSLSNGVRFYFDKIGLKKKIRPVNRLDLNTSGIVIFAKNEYFQEELIKQMEKGSFKKEYLALVQGILDKKSGIINLPISRKENSIIERCVNPNGQRSITEYVVLKEYHNEKGEYSLVKCKLHTGRTHQIRVHFSYLGHPVLGDTLYGKKCEWINGQALHSYKVTFIHSVNKKKIEIISNFKINQQKK